MEVGQLVIIFVYMTSLCMNSTMYLQLALIEIETQGQLQYSDGKASQIPLNTGST